jgi:hypothetical protein
MIKLTAKQLKEMDKTIEQVVDIACQIEDYNEQDEEDFLRERFLMSEQARLIKKADNMLDGRWLSVVKK